MKRHMALLFSGASLLASAAAMGQTPQTRATLYNENNAGIFPNQLGLVTPQAVNSMFANTVASAAILNDANAFSIAPSFPLIGILQGNGAGNPISAAASTGTGTIVLQNSPTLITPALGTPSSVVLTHGTGLPIATGVAGLGAGVATALQNAANAAGGFVTSATSPVINVTLPPYNASPSNSATANATAFQAAYTAAAAGVTGGHVYVPCGHFPINPASKIIVHVAAGKHISTTGDAPDCSFMDFQGTVASVASHGIQLLLDDGTASFDFQNFTATTDTHGGQKAIDTELANGSGNTLGPGSFFNNYFAYGVDVYNATTSTNSGTPSQDYWDYQWYEVGINNVTWIGGNCLGANQAAVNATSAQHTKCVSLQGSGVGGNTAPGAYSVAINFFGFITASCTTSVEINDYVQGVVNFNTGSTFCGRGVYQTLASPVGFETEIVQVVGGQFFDTTSDIDVEDTQSASNFLSAAQLAGPGTVTLVKMQGTEYTIEGTVFGCVSRNGSVGLSIPSGFAQGGASGHNTFSGCGEGIAIASGIDSNALLDMNHFIGNGYAAFTGVIAGTTLTVSGATGNVGLDIGTIINGAGVATATSITAKGSGTGGNGTYTVNNSQTVVSETMNAQWLAASPNDYMIGAGSNSTIILDSESREFSQLPPCNSTIPFSKFIVNDTTITSYNGAITAGGGANDGTAYCSFALNEYVLR